MIDIKENRGITFIALIVMVIILIILAGISLTVGKKIITQAKAESYITNMITIKAKAKVYAEEVNAKTWDVSGDKTSAKSELYLQDYKMSIRENNQDIITYVDEEVKNGGCECYNITKETLTKMTLDELAKEAENNDYVVVYNSEDYTKLDVVYVPGVSKDNQEYYSLSSLQK